MEQVKKPALRAIVVGAGSIGANHIRIYNEMPEVELAGVVEPDPVTAASIRRIYRLPVFSTIEDLLGEFKPDLASVAVPTTLHYTISRRLLEAKIQVLVEKPISATYEEGQRLIRLGQENESLFTVGHSERFNPAVKELKHRLEDRQFGDILMIRADRLGHFPTRFQDTGVCLDLAIHDLDIFNWLLGVLPVSLYAQTIRQICTDYDDLVCSTLRYANGMIGLLNVNWVTPHKVRKLTLHSTLGMVEVNYLTQELVFYRNSRQPKGTYTNLKVLVGHNADEIINFPVTSEEPLKAELQNFVNASLGLEPLVISGEDGLRALYLAQLMVSSAEQQQILGVDLP